MNASYTFTTLTYVHDAVTGEFANIGILMYAPSLQFLEAQFVDSFSRLSRFFGSVQTVHLRRLVRSLQLGARSLSDDLFGSKLFILDLPSDATECAKLLLPEDDSALQFTRLSSGLTSDPWTTLDQLYMRYVGRYAGASRSEGRRDSEIWKVFRDPLFKSVPRVHLEPYRIVARNYDHQFPFSWRNGVLNVAEPVSFDLRDPQEIVDKANRWLGRGISLEESAEKFRMALLLGEPTEKAVFSAYDKATNILEHIPGDKQLFSESEPGRFAQFVKATLEHVDPHHRLPDR